MPISKKKDFSSIGELIDGLLNNLPQKTGSFKVYPYWKNWKAIVGPAIAEKTSPDYIQGNTLYVSVAHPVWLTELNTQKKTLLEKIAQTTKDNLVDDIVFKLKK